VSLHAIDNECHHNALFQPHDSTNEVIEPKEYKQAAELCNTIGLHAAQLHAITTIKYDTDSMAI
jgi:hypothetical protein